MYQFLTLVPRQISGAYCKIKRAYFEILHAYSGKNGAYSVHHKAENRSNYAMIATV